MERREFLKILGLGGVALTMPKPLEIVAAKMADISGPPLHAGFCEIGPLNDENRGQFVLQGISIGTADYVDLERRNDFYDHWAMTTRFVTAGDRRRVWLAAPVRVFPSNRDNFVYVDGRNPDGIATYLRPPMAYMFDIGERAEFWLTPTDRHDLPRFPLPKVTVILHGWHFDRTAKAQPKVYSNSYWSEFKVVRLERARAIEMGLVDPSEPEGIIV